MAVNSIAKLAVILTADTTQLSANMGRAQGIVRNFNSGVGNTGTLAKTAFKQAGDAAALMTGHMNKLGAVAGALGAAGGPFAVLAAVVGAIAFKLASISDAQRVASGASKAATWAGQWERAGKAANDIAITLGRPIADALANETRQIADILSLIAHQIVPDEIRAEQQKLAIIERQNDVLKRQQAIKDQLVGLTRGEAKMYEELQRQKIAILARGEHLGDGRYRLSRGDADEAKGVMQQQKALQAARDRREADAAASDEANRHFDEMQRRAKDIADAFRTPREEMIASFVELDALFAAGAMSAAQYDRSVLGTIEKFRESEERAAKAKKRFVSQGSVGAAERFTSAGVSAMHGGMQELKRLEQLQKQQVEKAAKAEMQREEIIQAIKDKQELQLVQGDL